MITTSQAFQFYVFLPGQAECLNIKLNYELLQKQTKMRGKYFFLRGVILINDCLHQDCSNGCDNKRKTHKLQSKNKINHFSSVLTKVSCTKNRNMT